MKAHTITISNRRLGVQSSRFLLAVLLLISSAWAEQVPSPGNPRAGQEQTQSAAGAPQSAPGRAVSSDQALYLVRATLLTLNDANRSGNYSVLRDLAAPDFQTKNTAADLAQIFSDLRRRNFDLFAAAVLTPQFTAEPSVDASGKLRLTGFFATRPQRISFDLTFQSVNGQWRLFGIAVATPDAPVAQSRLNQPERNTPAAKRSPGFFYGFRVLTGTAGVRW